MLWLLVLALSLYSLLLSISITNLTNNPKRAHCSGPSVVDMEGFGVLSHPQKLQRPQIEI